jgi:class 3 adenylate cyclase/tetratricopeptide (TPR) repeat protein
MQSISDWLQSLGLEQYAQAFADNDIDQELIPDLSDQDLKEIGVSSLGHRKKLLKAIAQLNETGTVAPATTTQSVDASPTPASSHLGVDAGERRQITVMFCDLVGSTELSRRLDPEDLRDIMRNYQESARQVINRYGGHIAQYLGDGLMVYFGWPQAHGDEAKRALRSSIEIVQAIQRSEGSEQLSVRLGIATGVVVIGDTTHQEAAGELAIGDTPNLAARLQSLAKPDTIVISDLTRRLAGASFLYQDLGEHSLKGIAEPVHVWGVGGLRDHDQDRTSTTGFGTPVLVGRDEEIGLLRRAWQQSKEGRGQVVLIGGEPGIGKSALIESLAIQLREEGVTQYVAGCSPYYTNSALYPINEHMKRVLDWETDAEPQKNLENMERVLGNKNLPLEQYVTPLASLLSLPLPEGRYAPLELSPTALKQRIFDDLIEWQLMEAERQPVLMIWEDLHWADPSTLEYLGQLIEQIPTVKLCLLLSFRTEFIPPWPNYSHNTPISLNRLERPQIQMLIAQLAKGKAVPQPVVDHVVSKTDGVPLYVEELTKTILESSILRETAERYEQTGPLSDVAIPATLHESLMARLDRLPSARDVAQLGAVLGREFAYDVMQAIGQGDESTLQDGLNQLVAGELLYQRGRPPRSKYTFKHALIQDAAYQSLLKRTRRRYHQEIAKLLEEQFPQKVATEPELLAYHYTSADMPAKAIPYWITAAKRAGSRSAYSEALAQVASGKALVASLPSGRDRTRLELQLEFERAVALQTTKGMTSPDTSDAFSAVQALCRELGDEVDDIYERSTSALATSAFFYAQWDRALEIGREILARPKEKQDDVTAMAGLRQLGFAEFFTGNCIVGRSHLEAAVKLYDYEKHKGVAAQVGQDPNVGNLAMLSWALVAQGLPDLALDRVREAIRLAEKLEHAHSHAYALHYASVVHLERGEYKLAYREAEAAINLSLEYGFPVWLTLCRIIKGEALAQLGNTEEGLVELRRGIDEYQGTGALASLPTHFLGLARALRCAQRFETALDAIHEGLEIVELHGERRAEADLYRLLGELLWGSPAGKPEAEAYLLRAVQIARAQSAKLLELRAATSLAKVWHEQGKSIEARELLTPVYNWFTEGFETRDLKEAKGLLDDLES